MYTFTFNVRYTIYKDIKLKHHKAVVVQFTLGNSFRIQWATITLGTP